MKSICLGLCPCPCFQMISYLSISRVCHVHIVCAINQHACLSSIMSLCECAYIDIFCFVIVPQKHGAFAKLSQHGEASRRRQEQGSNLLFTRVGQVTHSGTHSCVWETGDTHVRVGQGASIRADGALTNYIYNTHKFVYASSAQSRKRNRARVTRGRGRRR